MLAPSDLAQDGSGCVSMKRPSAPTAMAALAMVAIRAGFPPVTPDDWLGCCNEWVQSITTGTPNDCMKDCWVWLYRGAWAEWDVSEIEMAVPMSPDQVMKKRLGIFKHQSQKDGVVYQGTDSREFWQRAEERNRGTAAIYNRLGLAEYEAMEAFVRWKF